jgi:hypothetical protein
MKRSDALLSNKQSESTVLVDQQQHHRYQHYLILPSITNNTFVPISPSIQPTTAPGDINNNSFLNSSAMVDLPLYWPSNPSVYDDSRERQYLTPSKVFPSAESFFSNYHQY